MKKILSIFLAMLLLLVLAVPAFASAPFDPESLVAEKPNFRYATAYVYDWNGEAKYGFLVTQKPLFIRYEEGRNQLACAEVIGDYGQYSSAGWVEGYWTSDQFLDFPLTRSIDIYWANYTVVDSNGDVVYLVECDGSACPATDVNHDNICDDCGNVLAFSLRSTLLDYAYLHLANGQSLYTQDDFWLITENDEGGYTIYLSNEPFSYNMSSAVLSSSGTVHASSVITSSSGQNGGRGWTTKTPGTPLSYGNPVESSHDIEGFFPGALWEEMEAVTQGAIVAEQIRLNRTMGILVLCGVGCLALLVVLKIFGARSLIFRG